MQKHARKLQPKILFEGLVSAQVHTIHNQLVVCQAVDVTNLSAKQLEDAVDQQNCGKVQPSDSGIMKTFVDQRGTISIGLCVLHEIFSALKALTGGFDGCLKVTVNIYYLKAWQPSHALCMCSRKR